MLAEESGSGDPCRELALGHVDMMFHIFCEKGFPVSLEKAAYKDLYAFMRAAPPAKPVIVVLNKGAQEEAAFIRLRGAYPNGIQLHDALGSGTSDVANGQVAVTVPPHNGLVLVGL